MKPALLLLLLLLAAPSFAKADFYKHHGLLFFYGSQCPHCQRFAPLLHHLTKVQHIPVLALSLDNQGLPDFPDFTAATTEWLTLAFDDKPIEYPALFLINPESHTLYPVSIGALSEGELSERLKNLIPRIEAYEQGMRR